MNREIEYNYENAGKDELRTLSYSEAIREALIQAMTLDKNVFIMGQGINDKIGMFGATTDIYKQFGEDRVFDTPLAETGLTGMAVGAALNGLRPIYCHNRPDFLMLAMDQMPNSTCNMGGNRTRLGFGSTKFAGITRLIYAFSRIKNYHANDSI